MIFFFDLIRRFAANVFPVTGVLLPVLLVVSTVCFAQAPTAQPEQGYALRKVASTGSKRVAEADIIKATGLRPGSKVTASELKQAADRLSQSSVFAQVSYRFDGQTAEYDVVDADQFVPVRFENFLWFPDTDLLQRVHAAVPLFQGELPLGGNLSDQVAAALNAILLEKGIHGHVTSSLQSSPTGQPLAMQLRVDGITEKIVEIRFPGAATERLPLLQAATKSIVGTNYSRSQVSEQVKRATAPVYGKLGFLKSQVGAPGAVIVKEDPQQPEVALEVPVSEGDAYILAGINWSGAISIPAADLAQTVSVKPGGPADTTQLAGILARAKQLYERKGFMYVQVRFTATIDTEKHTAIFNLNVDEGPVYRMGKLEIQNLDASRAALVRGVWEIHEGDVYVANYVKDFLPKHARELESLDGWTSHYTQTIHDDTHVVDLTLAFVKMSADAK